MKNRAMQYTLVILLLCDCVYSTIKACFGIFQVVHCAALGRRNGRTGIIKSGRGAQKSSSPALLKKKTSVTTFFLNGQQNKVIFFQQLLIVLLSFKNLAGVSSDANIIVFGSKIFTSPHK